METKSSCPTHSGTKFKIGLSSNRVITKILSMFSDFLVQCETAMTTLKQLCILDDPIEHKKILSKLPRYIQERWLNELDNWIYSASKKGEVDSYPPFSALSSFVQKQARIASSPFNLRNDSQFSVVKTDVSLQSESSNLEDDEFSKQKENCC